MGPSCPPGIARLDPTQGKGCVKRNYKVHHFLVMTPMASQKNEEQIKHETILMGLLRYKLSALEINFNYSHP